MTKEEIHGALRVLARGFLNHPEVERLAEYLAGLGEFQAQAAANVLSVERRSPFADWTPEEMIGAASEPAQVDGSPDEAQGSDATQDEQPAKTGRKRKAA